VGEGGGGRLLGEGGGEGGGGVAICLARIYDTASNVCGKNVIAVITVALTAPNAADVFFH